MVEKLNPETMSDADLINHYHSAKAGKQNLWWDLQEAESGRITIANWESQKKLIADARCAWRNAENGDRFSMEISRRLHAPLKAARLAKGLSKGEAAKRAGWTRVLISDVEAGNHWVSFPLCIRMWKALDLVLPSGWETLA